MTETTATLYGATILMELIGQPNVYSLGETLILGLPQGLETISTLMEVSEAIAHWPRPYQG